MVPICDLFGAVLHLTFGLPVAEALMAAIAALTGLAFCTIAANTRRGRWASSAQIVELSRGVADLARQVVELGRRVATIEGKATDAIERAEAATEPLSAEIGEIGVLIKQLAEFWSVPTSWRCKAVGPCHRPRSLRRFSRGGASPLPSPE